MRCVKVIASPDGESRFGDIDIEQHEGPYSGRVEHGASPDVGGCGGQRVGDCWRDWMQLRRLVF
jgi:hypothetical protein